MAWNPWLGSIEAIARHELNELVSNNRVEDSFNIMCIENVELLPDADPLFLRSLFAVCAIEDIVPLDFRFDYFLAANGDIPEASSNPGTMLRISIWEAEFDPVLTNNAGYNGAINVAVPKLFSALLPSIICKEQGPLKKFFDALF